jgi:phosphoribosylglycinamide formyltransferase-1
MTPAPASIAVLVSGTGRLLRELHARVLAGELDARLTRVVASRECPAAAWARDHGLAATVATGELTEGRLMDVLGEPAPDWVVLAGYLRKLPIPAALERRIVNIHPALLPRHGGPGLYGDRVHAAVLAAGDTESGCTVHLCDDGYDTGPVLAQARCPVLPGDTPEALAARVFQLERRLLPETLQRLVTGELAVGAGP